MNGNSLRYGEVPSAVPSFLFPGSPRSEAESCCIDDDSKFRQLPCRTFISCGFCPYRERCVFLHDPRLISKIAKTKTRKKNKEDVIQDSMFWPVLPSSAVNLRLDRSSKPHVMQHYSVPSPKDDEYRLHDQAIYSMWMHFVTLTAMESEESGHQRGVNEDDMGLYMHPRTLGFRFRSVTDLSNTLGDLFMQTTLPVNTFISASRLKIFQNLALGKPVGSFSGRRSLISRYSGHRTPNNNHPYTNEVSGYSATYGSSPYPHTPRTYTDTQIIKPHHLKGDVYQPGGQLRGFRNAIVNQVNLGLQNRMVFNATDGHPHPAQVFDASDGRWQSKQIDVTDGRSSLDPPLDGRWQADSSKHILNTRKLSDIKDQNISEIAADGCWQADSSKRNERPLFEYQSPRPVKSNLFAGSHTPPVYNPHQEHSATPSEHSWFSDNPNFNVRDYIPSTSHTPDLNHTSLDPPLAPSLDVKLNTSWESSNVDSYHEGNQPLNYMNCITGRDSAQSVYESYPMKKYPVENTPGYLPQRNLPISSP